MSEFLLIKVFQPDEAIKVSKAEVKTAKKGGLSAKMIRRMKLEAVDCPMTGKLESAVFCYNCSNYVRRVRGVVHCRYKKPENSV
ncbi:MAG: hypothetical protein ACETVV_00665 [Nitrososphaeria archaeon]